MSDEMRFRIIGLDCADEVVILERAIGPLRERTQRGARLRSP